MYWWVGTLLGSLSLAVKNYLSRTWDMTFVTIMFMQIPLFAAGMFYWHGFRNAPKFINCWFLGSAFNALLGITMGLIFFDKTMTPMTAVAIAMIFIGAFILV